MANNAKLYIAAHPEGKVWAALDSDVVCLIAYGNATSVKTDSKSSGYGAITWPTKLKPAKGYTRISEPIPVASVNSVTNQTLADAVKHVSLIVGGQLSGTSTEILQLAKSSTRPDMVLAMAASAAAIHGRSMPTQLNRDLSAIVTASGSTQQAASAASPKAPARPKKLQGDGMLAWFNGFVR